MTDWKKQYQDRRNSDRMVAAMLGGSILGAAFAGGIGMILGMLLGIWSANGVNTKQNEAEVTKH